MNSTSLWLSLAGCPLGITAGLLVLRRCFVVVHVMGISMHPGFAPGDRVLVRRARSRLNAGAVVVIRPPHDVGAWRELFASARLRGGHWLIKRVSALAGDPVPDHVLDAVHGTGIVPVGTMVVLSDNPDGTDSRHWGFVPVSHVLGRVVLRLPPPRTARQDPHEVRHVSQLP